MSQQITITKKVDQLSIDYFDQRQLLPRETETMFDESDQNLNLTHVIITNAIIVDVMTSPAYFNVTNWWLVIKSIITRCCYLSKKPITAMLLHY